MRTTFSIIIVVALAAGLFYFSGKPPARPPQGPELLVGKPAPDISLPTLDGQDVKLSSLRGKVVLVDNWATWCPPCRESLPHLQAIASDKSLADKGLVVWAVDAQEEKPDVQSFLNTNHYTFTVLLDHDGQTLHDYGIDGILKNAFIGFNAKSSPGEIDAAIKAALAESAPH